MQLLLSVAFTTMGKVPVTVGVPLNTPADESVKPVGNALTVLNVTVPFPPACVKVWLNAAPAMPVVTIGFVTVIVGQGAADTVAGSKASLSPRFGSSSPCVSARALLVTLFVPVGVPVPTLTVSVSKGRLAPAFSGPACMQFAVAVPMPVQLQPVPLKEFSVKLPGRLSVKVIGLNVGPASTPLLTVRLYCPVVPIVKLPVCVLVSEMSGSGSKSKQAIGASWSEMRSGRVASVR